MNLEEYKIYANKLLELLPEAKAVAMDKNNELHWYKGIPNSSINVIWHSLASYYYLGKIDYSGDWRDTLMVKMWKPENGDFYFKPNINNPLLYDHDCWNNHNIDFHCLKHSLIFKTREEAVIRAKELLNIKE